jgi:2-polyprenyl-3-methyl-5-hydroxy-6-metoxy-1,4-benzoquinol methylase
MSLTRLTDESFWNDYWSSVQLPIEIDKSRGLVIAEITDVLDRYLQRDRAMSVLEIGGAPGQYAAYVHKRLGHSITILDSSPLGCEKTRENFDLLGIPGDVINGDLFDLPSGLARFDAVYSLGLLEHFDDVTAVVRAHMNLLAPGGTLLLGAPNLVGINRLLLRRLSPDFLSTHQEEATRVPTWDRFETDLRLTRLFRAYLGGFDPSMFWRCESRKLGDRVLHQFLRQLAKGLERPRTRFLRRPNAPSWSAYIMGAYLTPVDPPCSGSRPRGRAGGS